MQRVQWDDDVSYSRLRLDLPLELERVRVHAGVIANGPQSVSACRALEAELVLAAVQEVPPPMELEERRDAAADLAEWVDQYPFILHR